LAGRDAGPPTLALPGHEEVPPNLKIQQPPDTVGGIQMSAVVTLQQLVEDGTVEIS